MAFNSVVELKNKVMVFGFLSCILFDVIGWYLSGFITKPIKELVRSTVRLRNGEAIEIPIFFIY